LLHELLRRKVSESDPVADDSADGDPDHYVVPGALALVPSSSPRNDESSCSVTSLAVETLVRRYLPLAGRLARRLELSESDIAKAHKAWFAFRPESLDAPPSGQPDQDSSPLSDRSGQIDNEYERVNGHLTRIATMRDVCSLSVVSCIRAMSRTAARVTLPPRPGSRSSASRVSCAGCSSNSTWPRPDAPDPAQID
jgi:hypothetical protein